MPRLVFGLPLLFVAATVSAQPAGGMQIDEFRPAIDSRGYLTLNGTEVLGNEELSFGLGSLDWGHHLLEFQNGAASYSVDNMVSATLVAALGLELGGIPFELGGSLPISIMNGSRGPDVVDPSNPNNDKTNALDAQGLGDAGLHLKARLFHTRRLGVAAIASVYIPMSTSQDMFLDEPAVTPEVIGVADAKLGALRLAVNAGVRLRRTSTFTDLGSMTTTATMGTITTATEFPVGVAAAWAIAPEKFELIGEVFGAIPSAASHGFEELEALGGVKLYLAKNSYLSLGAGRGLVDQNGSPDFRAMIGIVFEPKAAARTATYIPEEVEPPHAPPVAKDDFPDRDHDGIRDDLDKCPDEPEDYNGFEDADGCPDGDRAPADLGDTAAGCTKTGPVDDADCADRGAVKVGDSTIVTLKSIEFEFDKAVIRPVSYPVLDAVALALHDNPDIELVEVRGHTDERGDDAYNLSLSERRAAAVVTYLIKQRVAPDRLTSTGFGETMPLDPAHNEAAWTKNRRVEFQIRKRAGELM